MIEDALAVVATDLKFLNIPYAFMMWKFPDRPERYWVGEYSVTPTNNEDGYEEGTIILTGTTKQAWSRLMEDRAKIKYLFSYFGGRRVSTEKGTVVIFYNDDFPVPTGDENLKRIQINLQVKTWKGMK